MNTTVIRQATFEFCDDDDGSFGVPGVLSVGGIRFTSETPGNAGEAHSINKTIESLTQNSIGARTPQITGVFQ